MDLKQILGDYQGYFSMQKTRLDRLGIDITGRSLSQLALRTKTYEEYLVLRKDIETHCTSNLENVWNGRPISKLLLKTPLDLGDGFEVPIIELIPPVHQRLYKMGIEHLGVVIGDDMNEFGRIHRQHLTGQQFQSPLCEPYYILFEDYTHVKFYRISLMDVCIKEGQIFEGFTHVNDWSY